MKYVLTITILTIVFSGNAQGLIGRGNKDIDLTSKPVKKITLGLKLHPNPAQNTLTVAYSPNSEYATTEITDLQGRILLATPFKKETDVSSLAPGVYMIRIRDGMSVKTSRFIKE